MMPKNGKWKKKDYVTTFSKKTRFKAIYNVSVCINRKF